MIDREPILPPKGGRAGWGAKRASLIAIATTLAALAILLAVRAAVTDTQRDRLTRTPDGAYQGHLRLPRGGPYILGIQGGGSLSIDGKPVRLVPDRAHTATATARIVYEPGVVALRFTPAGPSSRLVWHPPGRRGPPEYLPPAALGRSPADAGAARSIADGVLALLGLLAVLACIAFLARAHLRRADRRVLLATAALFAFALAVRLVGLGDAGQTWDEDVNWSAGRNYVTNLLALDFDQRSWVWNFEHPPWTKYLVGIGAQFADGYGPARAIAAVALALACALLVPIGTRLFSLRVGITAAVFAALSPHLIGHAQIVGHEATAALWWTLAIWLCLLPPPEGTQAGVGGGQLALRFALIGIILGLAIFSRFASALLAPLIGAILVIQTPPGHRKRTILLGLAIIPLTAMLFGVITWPRLWSDPIAHMREAWDVLSKPHGAEPYLGTVTNTPPWHYFAVYLVATAPIGLLLGALAFLPRAALTDRKPALIVALWLLVPLLIMFSPVRQDGVRYILPALFPLALAAAAGFDWLSTRLHPRAAIPVAAALAVYLAVTAVRIHPYYIDYYGEHIGGPRGAAGRFELGWWGEGIDRAMDHLNTHAAPNARVDIGRRSDQAGAERGLVPSHVTWMRADLWAPQITTGPWPSPQADWVLVNELSWKPFTPPPDLELTLEVTAQGAPLVRVYRRR